VATAIATDYVEVWWSGSSTNLTIEALPAGTSPVSPLVPSIILTAVQVMYTQLGPTGPTGATGPAGPVVPLNDLTDVTITTPAVYETIVYNGSGWVNSTLQLGTNTNGNYMSGVTSGTGIAVTHTPSEGSSATIAVDTSYAGFVPTGVINMWGTTTAPTNWLLCDGTAVSRTTYAALFAVISTTYGVGDNSTTFNLPNLKGKVPVGRDSADTSFDSMGETGGAKTHTLSSAEMPLHTHIQNSHNHSQNSHTHTTDTQGNHNHGGSVGTGEFLYRDGAYNTGYNSWVGNVYLAMTWNGGTAYAGSHSHNVNGQTATNIAQTATNQYAGSSSAHNNLQPYIVLNYIIKT
jgi:microcystin-dependent protein